MFLNTLPYPAIFFRKKLHAFSGIPETVFLLACGIISFDVSRQK